VARQSDQPVRAVDRREPVRGAGPLPQGSLVELILVAHFFGVAAQLMRHILVDFARARLRAELGEYKQ
jgi:hypothetical protein